MRSARILFTVVVSAVLATGSVLLLRTAPDASGSPARAVSARAFADDCAGTTHGARWSSRLTDESSDDSIDDDDDDDDGPDAIAVGPVGVDARAEFSLRANRVVVTPDSTELRERSSRGPPAHRPCDASQDSTDDDDDDAPCRAIVIPSIPPIDLFASLLLPDSIEAVRAVDVDIDAVRGPPSPPLRAPPFAFGFLTHSQASCDVDASP
jgi:hypothetical protein